MAIINLFPTGGGGISLVGIDVTTAPAKTAYHPGESFDPSGMVVTATYSNGSTAAVGGYSVSPATLSMGTSAVIVSYSEGGVTRTDTTPVTVTKWQVTVPSVSGTLIYNGGSQSPTILNEPSMSVATRGGDASGIDAGSYTKTYTLVDPNNYEWAGSFSGSLSWTIRKKTTTLTLSTYSITLNSSNTYQYVTVTTDNPDGTISAISSISSVASVVYYSSAGYLYISSPNRTAGTSRITVSQVAGTNYSSATASLTVTASFDAIYGAQWDGTSTTSWTRTDGASNFTNPVPYVSGSSSYSSPFDNISPWKDMTKVTDSQAGSMVKIPKFYYKITTVGSGMKIQISPEQQTGYSVCPACMDRGDGSGERDYVLVGRYHCAAFTYKSTSGAAPAASVTKSAARTAVHHLGTKVWMMDFATRFTIWLLYIVEFASWDCQSKIGFGCGDGSAVSSMGYTDNMPYHTGTTKSSRSSYGYGTQYRYIEGLWDNVFDWMDGCYYTSSGLYIIKNPSSFSDSSGGTFVSSVGTTSTNAYPTGFAVRDVSGTFPMFVPTSGANSGGTTYSCDAWAYNSSYAQAAGASYVQGYQFGLFCFYGQSPSSASRYIGARPMKLP